MSFMCTMMELSPEKDTFEKTSQNLNISLIIPVFNQANKIHHSLEKIKQVAESTFNSYELIVVNDGSTDQTLPILRNIASIDPHIRILSYTPNRGKGYAVKQGVLQSRGDAVIFLDGDLDIAPDSIKEYVDRLNTSDLVIASKRHPQSTVTIPTSRAFLSRSFNFFIKLAVGIPQKDTQAGFKVGNGEIMRKIFKELSVNRYAFDVELFTLASIMHLQIQEMPVVMRIDRGFKVRDIVNMFMDVIRISYKYRVAHQYQNQIIREDSLRDMNITTTKEVSLIRAV
jgi:glycosyltransferase involved in cell wall biosynthesis